MHNLLQAVEWSNQKFVGPDLQTYGLATSLISTSAQNVISDISDLTSFVVFLLKEFSFSIHDHFNH